MKMIERSMSRLWLSLGTSLCVAVLGGCGGGDGKAAATASSAALRIGPTAKALSTSQGGATATAVSTAVAPHQAPTIVRLEQISATRVDRTRYDYVFALHVKGSGLHIKDGAFTGTATGIGSQVLDGQAKATSINAGRYYVLDDTITVRHDRTHPFDPTKLVFAFVGTLVDRVSPGGVQIGTVSFYVPGGRPGHEGYFKSNFAEPLAGQEVQLNVAIQGVPTTVTYQLLELSGSPLSEASLKKLWPERDDHTAMVTVPPQPFKIKVSAVGADGAAIAWVSDTYLPRTLSAAFAPKSGAVFRHGEKLEAAVVVAPVQGAGGARVSLILPPGFTADRTNWLVPTSGTFTRIPVLVQTPASGPASSFYELAVAIKGGLNPERWIATTQLLGR